MKQNCNISTGEVIVLHSDRGIAGYSVALKSFNIEKEANLFFKDESGNRRKYLLTHDFDGFVPYMITKGLIIPIAHREIDLDYLDLEEE